MSDALIAAICMGLLVAAYLAAYQAAGYDFLKPHDEGVVGDSVVTIARRLGLPLDGHLVGGGVAVRGGPEVAQDPPHQRRVRVEGQLGALAVFYDPYPSALNAVRGENCTLARSTSHRRE